MRGLLALPLLLVAASASAQPVEWQAEQWSWPGFGPSLVAEDEVGNAHLTYAVGGFPRHLVLSTGGSLALDESQDDWYGELDPTSFGPAIAYGPKDYVHLVWKSVAGETEFNTWYARKSATVWTNPVLLNQGQPYGWAARVAADDAGVTVALSNGDGEYPAAQVRAWRLVDAAATDLNLTVLPARSDDRIALIAGPALDERHLFSGLPDVGGSIRWARSVDGGASWSTLGALASATCGAGRVGQPDAAVAPDGTVHLVYGCSADSEAGDGPSVRHVRIVGTVAQSDEVVTAAGALSGWGELGHGIARVAVNAEGTVGVLYLEHATGPLWATSSDDGGASWHAPIQLAAAGGAADGRDTPAIASAARVFFAAWPDGAAVHFRRGLGPLLGDDDDSVDDDDSADDDDDDDDDDSANDDDDLTLDDDDSGWIGPPAEGCCGGGGGGGSAFLPLLVVAGWSRRGSR